MRPASPSHASIRLPSSLADVSLADVSLADVSLTDASLADASLADASLANVSLANASLANASLPNASLANASLANASLARFSRTGCARTLASTVLASVLASLGAAYAAPAGTGTVMDPPIITIFGDPNSKEAASTDTLASDLKDACGYLGISEHTIIAEHIAHFVGRRTLSAEAGSLGPGTTMLSRYPGSGRWGDASMELERFGPYDRFGSRYGDGYGSGRWSYDAPIGSPFGSPHGAPYGPFSRGRMDALYGCTYQDLQFAEGRAHIRMNDRSLQQARAAYLAKDYPKALDLFKEAYNKIGYHSAGLMLGKMHLAGEGTERDVNQAVKWLDRVALERGANRLTVRFQHRMPHFAPPAVEARVRLGNLYVKGDGVEKDPAEARYWYKKANENDYIPARYVYARMLETGYGGSADLDKAVKLYKDAAEHGYAPAQYRLAELYAAGEGVERNLALAFQWFQQAAINPAPDHNQARAQAALAEMYDRGEGVAADPAKALGWYKKAAVAGHPVALNALATYFYKGEMVQADQELSRSLFLQAAVRGNPEAMVNGAAMAYRGEGGARNPVQAYALLALASKMGNKGAEQSLAAIAPTLSADEKARAEALLADTPKFQ
jgi:hypothetical protein